MIAETNPIGIFDSGVGGLSALRAIRVQMPEESVIYFGDQADKPMIKFEQRNTNGT
jgi:glutamate racemase